MTGSPRRLAPLLAFVTAGLLLVFVTAGLLLAVGARPASAAPSPGGAGLTPVADCTTTAGVLVAVDFGHWGGPIVRGCSEQPADAMAAMHAAGFLTAGDEANGSAFVCRIGLASKGSSSERPTPSSDPCVTTPPATAYWSFWYADAGQSTWAYSPTGAATFRPAAGSVEAWEFGAGRPPAVPPARLRSHRPAAGTAPTTTAPTTTTTVSTAPTTTTTVGTAPTTTATTTPDPTSSGRHRSAGTPTAGSPSTTAPTARRGASGGAEAGAKQAHLRSAAATTTTPTTPTTRIVDAAAGTGPRTGGNRGSPAGLIAGAAAVAVLAAGAGVVARRRRRTA